MVLSAHANPKVLPDPVYKGILNSLTLTSTMDAPVLSRCPSLLNFALIFLPIKAHFFPREGREKQTSSVGQDLGECLLVVDFELCLHSQLLNLLIEEVLLVGMDDTCSGFMEAGSMISLGLLPMANSVGVVPLRVTCVFLTVVA